MKQIVSVIRKHLLPLLVFNSLVLAGTIYATIYASTKIAPVWNANAQLNLPQISSGLDANLGTLGSLRNLTVDFQNANPMEVQLAILTSDAVMERVRALDPEASLYSKLSSYKNLFVITPQQMTSLVAVETQGNRPDVAYKRLVNLITVYQQRLNELRYQDGEVRAEFSQQELRRAHVELIQTQNALAKFQQSTGLIDNLEQTKGLLSAVNNLKTTRATVLAQAQASQIQAQQVAAHLGITPQKAINSVRLGENKEYQTIRDNLSTLDNTLAQTRSKYREDSPQVQSLLQQRQEMLRLLDRQIATAIPRDSATGIDKTLGNGGQDSRLELIVEAIRNQTIAEGLQQQANQIQAQIAKLNAELNSISKNQAQFLELKRRFEIAEGVYKGIVAQTQQSKTNPFSVYPNVQTLDEPTLDPNPSVPSLRLVQLGGILAAIFGSVALIFFLENRNPLLKPQDLQEVELPILGSIPHLKRPNMERHLGAEIEIEFQRLASAILMLEHQRLMITSATAGEGKTTTTLGLAIALVNFGFRVLIVDSDLRQAQLSRRLGHLQTRQKANIEPTPISVYPGLDLLPAPALAKDKIAEFFARGSFAQRLSSIQNSGGYDYVLVDSPPVSLACETNLIHAVVRNVLFVVRSGTSDRYPVMDSLEQLTRHNAHILGAVINSLDSRTDVYRSAYGRQRELLETEA